MAEAANAGAGETGAQEEEWSAAVFLKTRPCKHIVMEAACPHGDECFYAHAPDELRPLPPSECPAPAPHWQGAHVCIGVVEHAMFWDLPPRGTLDVVCNRASCLGNPFGGRWYRANEPPPVEDAEGWKPVEHEELCAAFAEYLAAVLDETSRDSLTSIVSRIARARSCNLAETWLAQRLQRADILRALNEMGQRVANGERVRLLCHCRPHVKCHTELLKAHLEKQAPASPYPPPLPPDGLVGRPWPGRGGPSEPRCAARQLEGGACARAGRALNPGDTRLYCVQCWIRRGNELKGQVVDVAQALEEKPGGGGAAGGDNVVRCRYHMHGVCRFGENCRYSHEAPSEDPPKWQRPLCYFFAHGQCKFGAQCYYRHADPPDSAPAQCYDRHADPPDLAPAAATPPWGLGLLGVGECCRRRKRARE